MFVSGTTSAAVLLVILVLPLHVLERLRLVFYIAVWIMAVIYGSDQPSDSGLFGGDHITINLW